MKEQFKIFTQLDQAIPHFSSRSRAHESPHNRLHSKINTFKTIVEQEMLMQNDQDEEKLMDVCPTCYHIY